MAPSDTADAGLRGWDEQAVSEVNISDAVPHASCFNSSGFTAINQQTTQLLTPQSSSTAPIQQNQARRRRRHNPAVARYLGLGSAGEPAHLEKYAPPSDDQEDLPSKPARKRRKLPDGNSRLDCARTIEGATDIPKLHYVSEIGHVTKKSSDLRKPTVVEAATVSAGLQPSHATTADIQAARTHSASSIAMYQVRARRSRRGSSISTRTIGHCTLTPSPVNDLFDPKLLDSTPASHNANVYPQDYAGNPVDHDEFDDNLNDEDLLIITSEMDKVSGIEASNIASVPSRTSNVDEASIGYASPVASANTALDVEEQPMTDSQRFPKKFISPVTLTTRLLATTCDTGQAGYRMPIARPPFPVPVRDRSPIIGLSSSTLLRTCFRIGEAINQGCYATKSGKHVIIELYARVLQAARTDTQQQFTFCDLFHARPPYIKGAYEAAIWKSVQLFDYDSKRLLQQGRICRCIGTMKRVEREWVVTVLNIWEATWEDVEWAEAIVKSGYP